MWAFFYLRNIALKFFLAGLLFFFFLRNNIRKILSSPGTSFGNLLPSSRNFVLLNNEVTEPLHLLLAVQTDKSFLVKVIIRFQVQFGINLHE